METHDCHNCRYCSDWEDNRAFCRNAWFNIPYCFEVFCLIGNKKPLLLADGAVLCECAPDVFSRIQSCSGWRNRSV